MSRFKATLRLDEHRREEQAAFVRERVSLWHELGDLIWTEITEEQADTFAARGILVQFHKSADLVLLPAVLFDPAEEIPEPPEEFMAVAPTGNNPAYYLVQFNIPPARQAIAALEELGASYVDEMALNVGIFQMTAQQATEASDTYGVRPDETTPAESERFVRWIGIYHPAYAVSFQLLRGAHGDSGGELLTSVRFNEPPPAPPSADAQRPLTAREFSNMRVDPTRIERLETGNLEIVFFANHATGEMRTLVEEAGATVVSDTGRTLIVDLPAERLPNVVRIPGVRAVEPFSPSAFANQRAGIVMGANEVRRLGNVNFLVNLDGTGEIVGVFDSGLDNGNLATLHTDFMTGGAAPSRVILLANANFIAPLTPPMLADTVPHGTHVTGSIAGDGFNAPPPPPPPAVGAPAVPAAQANRSVPRGIAPRAQIVFHSANAGPLVGGVPSGSNLLSVSLTVLQQAYLAGARIHNNSWRSSGSNNYTPAISQPLDEFAYLHPDMLILFAAGNDEADNNTDGLLDLNTLGQQAVCKNLLIVGACENVTRMDGHPNDYRTLTINNWSHAAFNVVAGVMPPVGATPVPPFYVSDSADNMALFSNRGLVNDPTATPRRRVRPDVVAPGTNILSTGPNAMLPLGLATSVPTTAPAGFYFIDHGTSMATPLTSGVCALVRQFYRARFTQLRRPLLIETLSTAAPPIPYVDLPSICAHASGCVLAWVRADAAAGPNHIRAAVYSRQLARTGNVEQLEANVGARPAICIERHEGHTLLAFRASDNAVRVSLFDDQLHRVNAFGTNGTVRLAPASRDEADRRPTLCVQGNVVAVAWVQTATNNLVFQRLRADTGALNDATPKTLGICTNTSTHPYLLHNGDRYAAAWARLDGAQHKVLLRFVNTDANPVGANPFTLATEAQAVRDVHLAWDARANLYALVWVRENAAPAGGASIFALRVNPDGTAVGNPTAIFTVPAPGVIRRPRIAPHPDLGQYTLTWEDNTQNGTFDLYLAFPTVADIMNGGLTGTPLRISDTPQDTGGFASLTDANGVLPVWQSNDEINSDMRGVFALNVTPAGVFDSQRDATAVLLENGHYTRRLLREQDEDMTFAPVPLAWGGGDMFQFRLTTNFLDADVNLFHLSADGKPDTTWSADGSKNVDMVFMCRSAAMHWTGRRLLVAYSFAFATRIKMFDGDGNLDTTFGTNGTIEIAEVPTREISVQLGRREVGFSPRVMLAYGRRSVNGNAPHMIRFMLSNERSLAASPAMMTRDLVAADGTAQHGWFHVLETETPPRFIAIWHVSQAGKMNVLLNLFEPTGTPQAGFASHIRLMLQAAVAGNAQTPLPGDSQNAVVAPRPVFFGAVFPLPATAAADSSRREFGAAWQYRPTAASAWEIRFSRLNRDGTVRPSVPNPAGGAAIPTQNVQVFANAAQHSTDPQLVWHTDGYGLAWLQQPVAGGPHRLFFTVLDENGARVRLPGLGAADAVGPVTDFPLSEDAADVKSFHLVWNGRSFRIAWSEQLNGKLRHIQSALSVPRVAGGTQYDDPYKHPTSALIRATVINGATNFNSTSLPNVPAAVAPSNPNDGYGWGRVNLRQSLSPVPPVTFHARDDSTVAAGRTVRYEFTLPSDTNLLRVTLAWTDLPGNNIVNHLGLRVTTPDSPARVFVGNRWQTTPLVGVPPVSGPPFSAPVPTPPPVNLYEDVHNVQQVVISRPIAGLYTVEVVGGLFGTSPFMQFPGQPFALVFVGSGPEIRTAPPAAPPPAGPVPFY